MKRILATVLLAALLVTSLFTLSGCYTIKSGKMRSVEGTYELTGYSTDENEIEANGIKLYIVIKSDGNGYYAYTDNDTPLYFAEMKCRFTQDPEKSGYYSYVELNFTGGNDAWEKLGINAGWREKNLNSNLPKYKGNIFDGTYGVDYYVNVDFTRVSRRTDLSYIESVLGKQDVKPYGSMKFGGVYFYAGARSDNAEFSYDGFEEPLVYSYLSIDLYNNRGEAWYMKTSDCVRRNETFDVRIANEDGVSVIYLGEVRAPFDNNAPYYGAMRIPAKLTVGEAEYDGSYDHILYTTSKTADDIQEEIESKILAYERNNSADE